MQVMILAGGKGTRLKPHTTVLPKPLMPVGDHPILDIIFRQLKRAGVNDVILAVGHMSQLFEAFFQDGSRYGLRVHYSLETKPLGTAGPIALALERLEDNFLLMNGDLLTTLDIGRLFAFHKEVHPAATIAMYHREVQIDFGVIETDRNNRLINYIEKPTYQFDVSMGINVLNRNAVTPYLVPGEYMDIPDLMKRLIDDGETVCCYREPCYWLDIGRIDDYQKALQIFEANKAQFLPEE